MKRIYCSSTDSQRRKAIKIKRFESREAGQAKHRRHLEIFSGLDDDIEPEQSESVRNQLTQIYYRPISYKKRSKVVYIQDQFGIEEPSHVQSFFANALELLNCKSRMMTIDFKECTRVWPSAVTLLCALKQWTELVGHKGQRQQIAQFPSKSQAVNSYLYHCGFYGYVKIKEVDNLYYYEPEKIVKIKRQPNRLESEKREDELRDLLLKFSDLTTDEIEVFYDRISTEIFNNVTEHGISRKDSGWWVLAQYHETHQIISVSIADNGIGIRNSLISGPQREMIKKDMRDCYHDEGNFIKKAMEMNISGAFTAPEKKKEFFGIVERYERGQRRGKGLQRIRDNCKCLGIRLAILSCHGYYILDENGKEECTGSFDGKIFAGTMYHLTIKTRRSHNENYKYRNGVLDAAG